MLVYNADHEASIIRIFPSVSFGTLKWRSRRGCCNTFNAAKFLTALVFLLRPAELLELAPPQFDYIGELSHYLRLIRIVLVWRLARAFSELYFSYVEECCDVGQWDSSGRYAQEAWPPTRRGSVNPNEDTNVVVALLVRSYIKKEKNHKSRMMKKMQYRNDKM